MLQRCRALTAELLYSVCIHSRHVWQGIISVTESGKQQQIQQHSLSRAPSCDYVMMRRLRAVVAKLTPSCSCLLRTHCKHIRHQDSKTTGRVMTVLLDWTLIKCEVPFLKQRCAVRRRFKASSPSFTCIVSTSMCQPRGAHQLGESKPKHFVYSCLGFVYYRRSCLRL